MRGECFEDVLESVSCNGLAIGKDGGGRGIERCSPLPWGWGLGLGPNMFPMQEAPLGFIPPGVNGGGCGGGFGQVLQWLRFLLPYSIYFNCCRVGSPWWRD